LSKHRFGSIFPLGTPPESGLAPRCPQNHRVADTRRCPLSPLNRRSEGPLAGPAPMSASDPKRTSASLAAVRQDHVSIGLAGTSNRNQVEVFTPIEFMYIQIRNT